jgi:hypothetical protein
MANSTTAQAPRVQITAEYLSEDEPLDLPLLQHLKSPRSSHQCDGGRDMSASTLSELNSQNDEAHGNRLEKPCKKIGQKSDKAKCKSLKQELLNCEGKVLQNLDTPVRSWAAPPTIYKEHSLSPSDALGHIDDRVRCWMDPESGGACLDGSSFPLSMIFPKRDCIVVQKRCNRCWVHMRLAIHHQNGYAQVFSCFPPLTLPGVKRGAIVKKFDLVHRDRILSGSEKRPSTVQQLLGFFKSAIALSGVAVLVN